MPGAYSMFDSGHSLFCIAKYTVGRCTLQSI